MINPLAYQMGNPRGEYKPAIATWLNIILGGGIAAGALFGMVSVLSEGKSKEPLYVLTFLLLVGIGVAYFGYRRSRVRVQVFDQGIVYTRSSQAQTWRWEEIAFVWQQITKVRVRGIPVGTNYVYTIQHRNGQKIVLNNGIRRIKELGEMVQSETFTRLMPLAVAAYNGGQPLDFGKLTISQQGIGNGKEIVPWAQVKGVQVNQGYVAVKREGKWLRWANVPVAGVPNFFIFMALVDQIIGVKR
jgi:hypothetical protein